MKRVVKNNLLCLLMLTFWAVNNSAAQSLSTYDLTGKVKKMREYHYIPLDGCDYCENLQSDSTIVDFNENGMAIKKMRFFDSPFNREVVKYVYNYKYDGRGKIAEESSVIESHLFVDRCFRDNQGYIIRIEGYSRYTDDYYKEHEEVIRMVNVGLGKETTGNKLKLICVKYRQNWEDGVAKEISTYDCDGANKTFRKREIYDKNGWLLKIIDNNSSEDTYSYEFHANGNLAKQIAVWSNGLKIISIFNEKGLITSYNSSNSIRVWSKNSYTYKYDSHGNWINCKVIDSIINNTDIYKREITYYE